MLPIFLQNTQKKCIWNQEKCNIRTHRNASKGIKAHILVNEEKIRIQKKTCAEKTRKNASLELIRKKLLKNRTFDMETFGKRNKCYRTNRCPEYDFVLSMKHMYHVLSTKEKSWWGCLTTCYATKIVWKNRLTRGRDDTLAGVRDPNFGGYSSWGAGVLTWEDTRAGVRGCILPCRIHYLSCGVSLIPGRIFSKGCGDSKPWRIHWPGKGEPYLQPGKIRWLGRGECFTWEDTLTGVRGS